jgi:hypothetical protein
VIGTDKYKRCGGVRRRRRVAGDPRRGREAKPVDSDRPNCLISLDNPCVHPVYKGQVHPEWIRKPATEILKSVVDD